VSRLPARPLLVNVGCGPREHGRLPKYFDSWREVRVDSDESVAPDMIADLTDLSAIPPACGHAIWASHCVEHLYDHQVRIALHQFRRVLREDGFLCMIVPDLQTIAGLIVADRLHDVIYESAAGPVSAHDMLYGFGPAIARGHTLMAHRCGFTPGGLQRCFQGMPFGEVVLRRRPKTLELVAVARVTPSRDAAERDALLEALEL
jgi:hypothetical protein